MSLSDQEFVSEHWEKILSDSQKVIFKPGQVIFYEGHVPYGFFLIESGEVQFIQGENDCHTTLEGWTCPKGLMLATHCVMNELESCCTVIAKTECQTLFFPKSLVVDLIKSKRPSY